MAALGQVVRTELVARPSGEDPWTALRAAFLALRDPDASPLTELALAEIYHQASSLRARH